MIPVLYTFSTQSPLSQAVMYLLALVLVGYAAMTGWRSAAMAARDAKRPLRQQDQLTSAGTYAVIGGGLALVGLHYALPSTAFLGGKGEGIPLHTYGIMLALGFTFAVTLSAQMAEREWRGQEGQIKRDQIFDLALWVLLGGVGGAKILFLMVNWKDYSNVGAYLANPSRLIDCLSGGMVFYGGLIGAAVASFIYCRIHKIQFLRLADLAIPTVSLGQCMGRLGCFSAGCCWGDISGKAVRWGVHFPGGELARNLFGQSSGVASMAYQSQANDARFVVEATGQVLHEAIPGAVKISAWAAQHGHTLPVHPTQLYESMGQLVLFVTLMTLRGYRRFHGQIFAIWLMCYAVLRTTVELFRGDVERGTLHGLLDSVGGASLAARVPLEAWYNMSTSQFISMCMFALGATLLYRHTRSVVSRPAAGSAAAA